LQQKRTGFLTLVSICRLIVMMIGVQIAARSLLQRSNLTATATFEREIIVKDELGQIGWIKAEQLMSAQSSLTMKATAHLQQSII
jgi:hypothetical protein